MQHAAPARGRAWQEGGAAAGRGVALIPGPFGPVSQGRCDFERGLPRRFPSRRCPRTQAPGRPVAVGPGTFCSICCPVSRSARAAVPLDPLTLSQNPLCSKRPSSARVGNPVIALWTGCGQPVTPRSVSLQIQTIVSVHRKVWPLATTARPPGPRDVLPAPAIPFPQPRAFPGPPPGPDQTGRRRRGLGRRAQGRPAGSPARRSCLAVRR